MLGSWGAAVDDGDGAAGMLFRQRSHCGRPDKPCASGDEDFLGRHDVCNHGEAVERLSVIQGCVQPAFSERAGPNGDKPWISHACNLSNLCRVADGIHSVYDDKIQ